MFHMSRQPMISPFGLRSRIRIVAVLALLGLTVAGAAAGARASTDTIGGISTGPDTYPGATLAFAPSLLDISGTTQTPELFTVTGKDFTPGGGVLLAVFAQDGVKLYEARLIHATLAALPQVRSDWPADLKNAPIVRGGTLRESFGQLCGTDRLLRAMDGATGTWSNWLTVQFACEYHGRH